MKKLIISIVLFYFIIIFSYFIDVFMTKKIPFIKTYTVCDFSESQIKTIETELKLVIHGTGKISHISRLNGVVFITIVSESDIDINIGKENIYFDRDILNNNNLEVKGSDGYIYKKIGYKSYQSSSLGDLELQCYLDGTDLKLEIAFSELENSEAMERIFYYWW